MILSIGYMNGVKADHMVGSDITYKCTDATGNYKITLTLYRDCLGIPICPNPAACNLATCFKTVNVWGADPGCDNTQFGSFSCQLMRVRDVNPNPRCPDALTSCTNLGCKNPVGTLAGVERYDYEASINLNSFNFPPSCCNVRFTFGECCRSANISSGPTWNNFYIDAILNRCTATYPDCNSPALTNDPVAVICAGQPFVFNNGAFDPDPMDSLSFEFAPGYQSYGVSVNYITPYSAITPMPWSGPSNGLFPAGISCDPLNGNIQFKPNICPFVGVMAIKVTQWRIINGVYSPVGITRRDIMMEVKCCPPNNLPSLRTNPPSGASPSLPKTSWETCAGEPLCFDVIARDTDFNPPIVSDTTYLSWNAVLAGFGATFTPNYDPTKRGLQGPREDTYKFCWTPDDDQGKDLPYWFTIKANDSRCPYPGTIVRAFSVKVWQRADVDVQQQPEGCGQWSLYYTKNRPKQNFKNVVWSVAKRPNDWSFAGGAYNYLNVQHTPVIKFQTGGKYLVELVISMDGPNGGFCTKTLRDTLLVDTPVSAIIRDTFTCNGVSLLLSTKGQFGSPPYFYRWYNSIKDTLSPLNGPLFTSPFFVADPLLSRYYTLQVRDIEGCRFWDSLRTEVKSLPIGILPDSVRICFGDTFQLDPGNNFGNISKWYWQTTTDTTRTITRNDSNNYIVVLTDSFGCVQNDTTKFRVNQKILSNAGIDTAICVKDTMKLVASGGSMYLWRNLTTDLIIRTKNYDPSVLVNPTNTTTPTKYEVTVYQSYPDTTNRILQCSRADTVQVRVKTLPVMFRPQAIQKCISVKLIDLGTFAATPTGGSGAWFYPKAPGAVIKGAITQVKTDSLKSIPKVDTIVNVPTPFSGFPYNNYIKYTYQAPPADFGSGGCFNTDSALISIYPNPAVDAGISLPRCTNAGKYEITLPANLAKSTGRNVKPAATGTNQVQDFYWSGSGVDSSQKPKYFFYPEQAAIKSPGFNIITYNYNYNYNVNNTPAPAISCYNSDTTRFVVTQPPSIYAGSQVKICQNEGTINLTDKSGATLNGDPAGGGGYWTGTGPDSLMITKAIGPDGRSFNPYYPGINPGPTGVTYKLSFKDFSTGCLVMDTTSILIAPYPLLSISIYPNVITTDTTICQNTGDFPLYTRLGNPNLPGTFEIGSHLNKVDMANYSYPGTAGDAWGPAPGAVSGTSPNAILNTSHPSLTPGAKQLIFKYTYQIAGLNCSNQKLATITIDEPPQLTVTPGGAMCQYTTDIPVSCSSNKSITWSSPGGTFADPSNPNTRFTPDSMFRIPGLIPVTATTEVPTTGVCKAIFQTTNITVEKTPVAEFLCDNCDGCEPLTSLLAVKPSSGVPNPTYSWLWNDGTITNLNDSNFTRQTNQYDVSRNGKYNMRLAVISGESQGCSDTSTEQMISVRSVPVASFVPNPPSTTVAKPYFTFDNKSKTADGSEMSYDWFFGPLKEPPTPISQRHSTLERPINIPFDQDTGWTTVYLTVTTKFGCIDSTSRRIRIEPDITVFIPNAFKPSSSVPCEGEPHCNDVFQVSIDGYLSVEVFIFNRWGQQVFYTQDGSVGWNGKMDNKGADCPQDVYIYQVNATSFNGKQYKYSGSITLLR